MIFNNYFKQSKSPLYSFIFILPLFIVYELAIFAISIKDLPVIRNGADVLLRKMLAILGISGIYGMALLLLIAVMMSLIIFLRTTGLIPKYILVTMSSELEQHYF